MEAEEIITGFKKESLRSLDYLLEMETIIYHFIDLLIKTPEWQKKTLRFCTKTTFMQFRETHYKMEEFFCLWVKEKFKNAEL